jgi:hypothetical protein
MSGQVAVVVGLLGLFVVLFFAELIAIVGYASKERLRLRGIHVLHLVGRVAVFAIVINLSFLALRNTVERDHYKALTQDRIAR